jgi:biotin carboxylase
LRLGCRVITCDYVPDNPGHRLAHEYVNVSTTDHDAVLGLARSRGIDGILAFASDPAAWTAAYVAAELNLSGNIPESVRTLTHKLLFRTFLQERGFKTPRFASATDATTALAAAQSLGFPVMVKPVDSSGSKGVSRVERASEIAAAVAYALQYSRCATLIVEEWIERDGPQIAGDGLVVDGRLAFGCFGDEHFDAACCAHAPIGESFPGQLTSARSEVLSHELQRLFTQLDVRNLVFNLDAMFDRNGELVVLEIGPRAGGNALPQLIRYHTGVDLTDIAVRLALGLPLAASAYAAKASGFHASHIIHSRTAGRLAGFRLAPVMQPYLLDFELIVKPGALAQRFSSAKDALGYALFGFPDAATMQRSLAVMSESLQPLVQ